MNTNIALVPHALQIICVCNIQCLGCWQVFYFGITVIIYNKLIDLQSFCNIKRLFAVV